MILSRAFQLDPYESIKKSELGTVNKGTQSEISVFQWKKTKYCNKPDNKLKLCKTANICN